MQAHQLTPPRQPIQQTPRQKRSTQSVTNYKRYSSSNENFDQYNTIRKYDYRSMSNSNNDSQSDHKNSQISKYDHNKDHQEEDPIYYQQNDKALKPELSVIDEQSVVSSSLPIRERISHLLPGQMGANFTLQHRKLISTQIKLDQVLDFLRINRQKQKGQLLSSIKNTMMLNFELRLQLQHFKQILYLIPDFYIYTQRRDSNKKLDLLIALPQAADLQERKKQFRKRLYQYLNTVQGFTKNRNKSIPCIIFPFTVSEEQKKQRSISELKNQNRFWLKTSSSLGKINPYDALKPGNTQNFQQMLMLKIKQNQQRIKAEKQKQKQIKYGCKQLLAVFDQIPKIFKKRQKSSMFKSSIIQDLDKTLNIKQQIICKIFEVILDKYSSFFKIIEHKSGHIIQIQRKIYNQIRLKIQKDSLLDENISKKQSQ